MSIRFKVRAKPPEPQYIHSGVVKYAEATEENLAAFRWKLESEGFEVLELKEEKDVIQ